MIETTQTKIILSEVDASRSNVFDFTAGFFDSASLRMTVC